MANSDKRQAALDAVQDILKAKRAAAAGMPDMPGIGGQGAEVDIDIDPGLDMPEANIPQAGGNVEINDPGNVLGQIKNRRKQQPQPQQQPGYPGKSSGGTGEEGEGGYPDSGEEGGYQRPGQDSGEEGGYQRPGQDSGEEGGYQRPGPDTGEEGGYPDSGEEGGYQRSGPGENRGGHYSPGGKSDGGKSGGPQQPGVDDRPEQLKKSDEYVKDWNDAIDKFDNDEVSDEELDRQLKDKNNSQGTKDAISAIKVSRRRKLEIDPSTDERLKMPKNSAVKQFDDSDDEGEEPEIDRRARIDRIQREFDDAEQNQKDLQDIETDIAIKKGDAMRAQKKELDRIAKKGQLMDFKTFGVDLFKAVKSQLAQSRTPDDSYSRINPTYAGSDLLMPGQAYNDKYEKPVINVYFDQSGSWGESDVKKGIDALSSIRRFETQHKIKVNLFYFADHLHDNPREARWEGGTGGFDEVVKHVRDSGANNVIILTDSDIERQTNWSRTPRVQVKGCVWYLWKNGSRSITAPEYLSGLRDTYQYNLQ